MVIYLTLSEPACGRYLTVSLPQVWDLGMAWVDIFLRNEKAEVQEG